MKTYLAGTLVLVTTLALLSACNTQSIMQSPPTIQFPSTSSGGNPAPQQGGATGQSGNNQGQSSSGRADNSGDNRGQNSPGGVENPTASTGQSPSGRADNSGNTQGSSPAANEGQQKGETQNGAGAGEKTDDEILAEALDVFAGRGNRQQGTTAGQTGDRLASEGSAAASTGPPGTAAGSSSSTGETGNLESSAAVSSGPRGTAAGTTSSTGEAGRLDGELDRRFIEFDDMILGKREALTDQANAEGAAGGSSGGYSGDGDDPLQTAMIDEDLPTAGAGSRQSESGGSGGGDGGNEPSLPDENRPEFELPADIGPGQDDDIIARQLREAAMKEKDPELRAKLWDEYRKYKKDLQATR